MEGLTYAASVSPLGRKVIHQKASTSHAQVFLTKVAKHAEYPGEKLAALREAEAATITPLEWQTSEETLDGPDDFMSEIIERVVAGGSMCVLSWTSGHRQVGDAECH